MTRRLHGSRRARARRHVHVLGKIRRRVDEHRVEPDTAHEQQGHETHDDTPVPRDRGEGPMPRVLLLRGLERRRFGHLPPEPIPTGRSRRRGGTGPAIPRRASARSRAACWRRRRSPSRAGSRRGSRSSARWRRRRRRSGGACSASRMTELELPPTESPSTTPSRTSAIAAAAPARAWVGMMPIRTSPRPSRSPRSRASACARTCRRCTRRAPADRPSGEPDGEDAEGGQERRHGIVGRKEQLAEDGREIPVDGEVVPFEHAADGAGHQVALDRARLRRARCQTRELPCAVPDLGCPGYVLGTWRRSDRLRPGPPAPTDPRSSTTSRSVARPQPPFYHTNSWTTTSPGSTWTWSPASRSSVEARQRDTRKSPLRYVKSTRLPDDARAPSTTPHPVNADATRPDGRNQARRRGDAALPRSRWAVVTELVADGADENR